MSFTILTAISPSYASTLKRFIPTWAANSGASAIDVRILKGKGWSECIVERAGMIYDAVMEAARYSKRVVWLDSDIYVVRNLADGFADGRFISVARWPNINAGVIFFNGDDMSPSHWFLEVMASVTNEIARRALRQPDGSRGESDQVIWREFLSTIQGRVHKLDSDEWNYTGVPEHWATDLPRIKDTVRALHTRGNGNWPDDLHRLMHATFPEEMACTEFV